MQISSYHKKIISLLIVLIILALPYFSTPVAQAAITFDSTSSATTGSNTAQTLSEIFIADF